MENKIIHAQDSWEKYVYLDKEIGKGNGQNSSCYLSGYGNVFKKLNRNLSMGSSTKIRVPEVDIYFLSLQIESDLFVLPSSLLVKDNYLLGYFMKYIDAPTLNKLPTDTKVSDILNDINRVNEEVKKISKYHIRVGDIHSRDIYFKGIFHVGDIDASVISKDEDTDVIFNSNIKKIYNGFLAGMFSEAFSQYYNFVQDDNELLDMSSTLIEGESYPLNFKLYITKICEKLGLNVYTTTIIQLRECLKSYTELKRESSPVTIH